MLFPKGFKYMVGTWIGFIAGGFAWSMAAMCNTDLVAFLIAGIIGGLIVAAKW